CVYRSIGYTQPPHNSHVGGGRYGEERRAPAEHARNPDLTCENPSRGHGRGRYSNQHEDHIECRDDGHPRQGCRQDHVPLSAIELLVLEPGEPEVQPREYQCHERGNSYQNRIRLEYHSHGPPTTSASPA